MGLFDKLFGVLHKYKVAAKKFHQGYDDIYTFASILRDDLIKLREHQKRLVRIVERSGERFAGHAGLSKTLIIEEALIPELGKLEKTAEKRLDKAKKHFESAEKRFEKLIKPSAAEELEMTDVLKLLNRISDILEGVKEKTMEKSKSKDKLDVITGTLKRVSNELKEFHKRKKYGMEKKVLEDLHKIRLVRKIYGESKPFLICPNGHDIDQKAGPKKCPICDSNVESVLEYTLTRAELDEFIKESKFLNSHNDKRNHVVWRRWWREKQMVEVDRSTGYIKEHINVWVQLYGRKTKNVHLLVAA